MKPNDIARILEIHANTYMPEAPNADAILSHIHTKRRTAMKKRRTLLIVVILMVMGMVVAGAIKPDVMNRTYEWNGDALNWGIETSMGFSGDGRTYTQAHRDTWGNEFIDALEENDINVLLPSWKPKGLIFDDLTVMVDETGGLVRISYRVENKHNVVLAVDVFPRDENTQWTSGGFLPLDTDKEPKVYLIEGREILCGKNAGTDSIVWTDLCANVQLFGEFGDENVERMIQSME